MPINNATDDYPNGDTIQVVAPWRPPETWADLDNGTLNAILDKIDAGSPDGERYSATPSAKDRAAWRVVKSVAPHKSQKQSREIIRQWVKNEVLVEELYHSEKSENTFLGFASSRTTARTEDRVVTRSRCAMSLFLMAQSWRRRGVRRHDGRV